MKQKKYFISFNYGSGFGNLTLDIEKLTKFNITKWFKEIPNSISKYLTDSGILFDQIIILNIIEIK